MMGVLDNPVAARSRADRLREIVAERFTIEAMTDGVLDLYAQVRASLAQGQLNSRQ